jgi:hypothetical protein
MSEPDSLTVEPEADPRPFDAVIFEAVRPPVGRAIAAAALAAVLGASLWALMVIVTDHSFGIAAAGLGILSGKLVYGATGGKRGVLPFAAAAVSVVIAVVVGKYAAFAYLIHRDAQQRFGVAGAKFYGYLSGHTWDAFHSALGSVFGGFDLLWVAFGLLAAWRIVGLPRLARRS